jgi:hypothetical protein
MNAIEKKMAVVVAGLESLLTEIMSTDECTIDDALPLRMRKTWYEVNNCLVDDGTPSPPVEYSDPSLSAADNGQLHRLLRAFGKAKRVSAVQIREQLHCSRATSEKLAKLFPDFRKEAAKS